MYDWEGIINSFDDEKIVDYKIIHGFPASVEQQVKQLLAQDWQLYSNMYVIKAPGADKIDIVAQCMVLYNT